MLESKAFHRPRPAMALQYSPSLQVSRSSMPLSYVWKSADHAFRNAFLPLLSNHRGQGLFLLYFIPGQRATSAKRRFPMTIFLSLKTCKPIQHDPIDLIALRHVLDRKCPNVHAHRKATRDSSRNTGNMNRRLRNKRHALDQPTLARLIE